MISYRTLSFQLSLIVQVLVGSLSSSTWLVVSAEIPTTRSSGSSSIGGNGEPEEQQHQEVQEKVVQDVMLQKAHAQIDWLRHDHDGYFSEKIEIRRSNNNPDHDDVESSSLSSSSSSYMGLFARMDISANELLMIIPKSSILHGIPTTSNPQIDYWFECDMAQTLYKELKLGIKKSINNHHDDDDSYSNYSAYIDYLLEVQSQNQNQIPSAWSDEGQELLYQVLGYEEENDLEVLPPTYSVDWIDYSYMNACKKNDENSSSSSSTNNNDNNNSSIIDPLEIFAALQVIQRGWDTKLVPVFDMINHHNGKQYINIHDAYVNEVDDVKVYSNRKIVVGEELLIPYTKHIDLKYKTSEYYDLQMMKVGTPEILRDFGFVESYPRKFYFTSPNEKENIFQMGMKINYKEGEEEEEDDDAERSHHHPRQQRRRQLELTWIEPPNEPGIAFLVEQYARLQNLASLIQPESTLSKDVPHHELDVIQQYYEALVEALWMGIEDISSMTTTRTTITTAQPPIPATATATTKTNCSILGTKGCNKVDEIEVSVVA